jgi:hypothetical protein
MDLGDLTQIVLVATVAATLGRVGFALARMIERRAAAPVALPPPAEERLRRLEDECSSLRLEVAEMQERQDFTERALLRDPGSSRGTRPELDEHVFTPH